MSWIVNRNVVRQHEYYLSLFVVYKSCVTSQELTLLSKCRNLDFLYVIEEMGIAILKQIHISKVDHRFQGFYPKKQYLVCILNTCLL